ncbi:MAG: insulinase family protein [Clostridia bacterium]|nr:insulinase family protein [Clostridia bacterium]
MIEQIRLGNGIRVCMEHMDSVRSVALGVWVNAGSVFETESDAGVSHFIEHMLFKGTETRSASDIAAETDAIGANLNAFTAKECTCFHIKALDEDLALAVEMLSDILLHSTLEPEQMDRERGVVLEEIAMTEDSPEDIVFDRACEQLFKDTPIESEILGTEETVGAMRREDLVRYMQRHYTAENTVIAVAGSFERETLLALLERYFADVPHGERHDAPAVSIRTGFRTALVKKDVEQINLCLALPGAALGTDEYYAQVVLSNALGGSMSSRLFQHIREERGLAYSVYSYPMAYRGAGCLCFYAGCTEGQAGEVLSLMLRELDDVKRDGISEDEFIRARQQLKGSYLLGMESTMAHMSALGKTALLLDKEYDLDGTLHCIERVTPEAVQKAAKELFSPEAAAFCAVGRLNGVGDTLKQMTEDWWQRNGRQA